MGHSFRPDDLAQIVAALADETGYLGRPLPALPILLPTVRLETNRLVWNLTPPGDYRFLPETNLERLVADFVSLKEGAANSVLAFAQKYGPLGLCQHNLPLFHSLACNSPTMRISKDVERLKTELAQSDPELADLQRTNPAAFGMVLTRRSPLRVWGGVTFSERLSGWYAWSKFMRSLLSLAVEVKSGEVGDAGKWAAIGATKPGDQSHSLRLLAVSANRLLLLARPAPRVSCRDGALSLEFVNSQVLQDSTLLPPPAAQSGFTGGVFSTIVIGAIGSLAGGKSLQGCSGCGRLYSPVRTPTQGKRHFCTDCGNRASWRLSKRRSRAEKSDERKH
jgi:hypothetical protein